MKVYKIFLACFFLTVITAIGFRMRWDKLIDGSIPMLDFDAYYFTARDVLAGHNPLTVPYMQTGGPPSVILAYLPFALIPHALARGVMTLLNLSSIGIAAWFIARKCIPKFVFLGTLGIATFWLISFPVRFNLGQGQPNLWLMALAAFLLTGSSAQLRGISAGLMSLIKTNYLILCLSLWRSRSLRWIIAVFAGIVVVGLPFIKPQYYQAFFRDRLTGTVTVSPQLQDVDYYNQSLKSTLARFQISQLYLPTLLLFSLAALVYLLVTKDTVAGLILSLILSPLLWQHYVVVVYPLITLMLITYCKRIKLVLPTLLAFGLLMVEFPWLHGRPLTLTNGLIASHYFFGLCLLLVINLFFSKKWEISMT